MDIGSIFPIGCNDALIHQLDHLAGSFIGFIGDCFLIFFFKFNIRQQVKVVQGFLHRLRIHGCLTVMIKEKLDIFLNVFPNGDGKINFARLHQGFNVIGLV